MSRRETHQFLAIDCEFVKAQEKWCLARISLVDEEQRVVMDSYVRPTQKITDYLTSLSGITYQHIKNAQSQVQVISEAKKLLLNKIVVGHTLDKDLEICGLTDWKGFKGKIDISLGSMYSDGTRKNSLKNLSWAHLGLKIQSGEHSSVEDAIATMQLFLKHRKGLMKENKLIR